MYLINESDYVLRIGRTGENGFSTFAFDVSAWTKEYPAGEILCVYRRPDNKVYPVTIIRQGDVIEWTATATELAAAGNGELQLWIMDGDVIGKSKRIQCVVVEALEPGPNPPAPGMDWITETIKETAEAAKEAKEAREELLAAAERGDFDGPPGNIDEEQIAAMINAYLAKHPLSIPPMSADVLGGAKLGENLKMSEDGHLSVDTADTAAGDNTRPITSAAVNTIVGNIEILLETI